MNQDMVHIHSGILLGDQKDKLMSFAVTWMGLEEIMLSEISHKENENYCMVSLKGGK